MLLSEGFVISVHSIVAVARCNDDPLKLRLFIPQEVAIAYNDRSDLLEDYDEIANVISNRD